MKSQVSPVAAGVIVVLVLVAALFFLFKKTGPGPTVDEPQDMKKMMGKQNIAPPQQRNTGSPMGMPGSGGPPGPGGGR